MIFENRLTSQTPTSNMPPCTPFYTAHVQLSVETLLGHPLSLPLPLTSFFIPQLPFPSLVKAVKCGLYNIQVLPKAPDRLLPPLSTPRLQFDVSEYHPQ
ncbi:hypothetical protein E2C01_054903 [Portunus trituberculatus]|uniref:Uncharacterized protein n=1 Tax=Portunus trituberculatus TaxID=210409 RepID=A0A5B7GW81_PORTR|nr:hypothetical protein [Portunus trituberculatus]